jgi:hypothetical protein
MTNKAQVYTRLESDPPLAPVTLSGRQIGFDENDWRSEPVFDIAFQLFRQLERFAFDIDGAGSVSMTPNGMQIRGRGRERRYAGDPSLSRNRYYSIIDEALQHDHGTLANEIRSYYSFSSRCAISLFDPSCEFRMAAHAAKQWGIDLERVQHYAIEALRGSSFLVLIIKPFHILDDRKLAAGLRFQQIDILVFPIKISAISRQRVFDLRLPQARDWLQRSFVPYVRRVADEKNQSASMKHRIIGDNAEQLFDFTGIVPTLLTAAPGGGHPLLQVLGRFLREIGADGLIFPSARVDCCSTTKNGVIKDSSGWNFVDYFGAQPVGHHTDAVPPAWAWCYFHESYCGANETRDQVSGEHFITTGITSRNQKRFVFCRNLAVSGAPLSMLEVFAGVVDEQEIALDEKLDAETIFLSTPKHSYWWEVESKDGETLNLRCKTCGGKDTFTPKDDGHPPSRCSDCNAASG